VKFVRVAFEMFLMTSKNERTRIGVFARLVEAYIVAGMNDVFEAMSSCMLTDESVFSCACDWTSSRHLASIRMMSS